MKTAPAAPVQNALLSRIAASAARPPAAAQPAVRAAEPYDHVTEATLPANGVMLEIPISRLERDPKQPRKIFEPAKLAALAKNMRELGQISSLSVYPPKEKGGNFVISAGERRWRAAELAEIPRLRCSVVRRGSDAKRVLIRAIADNVQREDLQPIEEARSYRELVEMGLSQKEIAEAVGVKPPRISESLAILNLPSELLDEAETLGASAQVLLHLSRAEGSAREDLMERLRRGETVKRSDARKATKKAPGGAGEGDGEASEQKPSHSDNGTSGAPSASDDPTASSAAAAPSPAAKKPEAPATKGTENTRAYEITYTTVDGVRVTIATADVTTARRALRYGLEDYAPLQAGTPRKKR